MLSWVRSHKWLATGGILLVFGIGGIAFAVTRPKQVEYVTALVERGDLRQTVEAIGTVISDRDLELQFLRTGIVEQILVKEGDLVKAGQTLARLRAAGEAADIASASARVTSAEADLRAMREGTRPEDIAIAEAQLQNSQAQLDVARSALQSAQRSVDSSEDEL